ncbi:MAG: endonuclease/exonuclease/phosphatase family protein [Thermomicrobiales bacterium]
MRRACGFAVICILVLCLAQGCLGSPASVPTPTSPAPAGVTAVATATVATPTQAVTATAIGIATGTAPATPATPASAPAPTPTEARLGINPPGTPTRIGPPAASPTVVVAAREATIDQIQGPSAQSPLAAQTVRTVGVVTADYQGAPSKGFFIQEPGTPKTDTSSGLFVYQGDRPTPDVKVGDNVTVVGVVREYNGRTELDISLAASDVTVNASGNSLPAPIEVRPPGTLAEAQLYFERYEGMLVSLPAAVVVAPTNQYGEFTVVRADTGLTHLFANDPKTAGYAIVVDDEGGAHYDLTTGDKVEGIVGPLDYSFGQYKVEQLPEPRLFVQPGGRVAPALPTAGLAEFTIASFNLENFFDPIDTPGKLDPCNVDVNGNPYQEHITPAAYALKLSKAGAAIRDVLGAPTLVAVQEVENLDVLTALAQTRELAPYHYTPILLEGLDPRGIDVGLLYRTDRVTVGAVTQRNECVTTDYGFTDVEARCSSHNDGTQDGWWLAARPPLVIELTVKSAAGATALSCTLIVNHFKAKSGTDPAGKAFVSRRIAEATLVARIVNEALAANPQANVMVVGDLNDDIDSPPLHALTTLAPLSDLALAVPAAERYSYIYQGEAQVLDHILVTAGLKTRLEKITYAHLDADFPESRAQDLSPYRVSDHDPPVAWFKLAP